MIAVLLIFCRHKSYKYKEEIYKYICKLKQVHLYIEKLNELRYWNPSKQQ